MMPSPPNGSGLKYSERAREPNGARREVITKIGTNMIFFNVFIALVLKENAHGRLLKLLRCAASTNNTTKIA